LPDSVFTMILYNISSEWFYIPGFFLILLLLFCSALISGSEIAYFSLNPGQISTLREGTSRRHKLALRHLEHPRQLLATILVANNFVNVSIVILCGFIANRLFDLSAYPVLNFLIQVVVITAMILLIGEIMPKIWVVQSPVKFALFMAIPVRFLTKIFFPLSNLLVHSTGVIDKKLRKKARTISMEDLSEALDIATEENGSEKDHKMLREIVKFGNIDAKEIMKSRVDVIAIDISISFSELIKKILDSGYSRIPVYEGSFDQVRGILYIKDLLPYLNTGNEFNWTTLIRDAIFVPENKKIDDLLQEFRKKKIHMAVVVDEYGGTSGIITLEDILEEIVGEIKDEFDTDSDEVQHQQLNDHTYLFEGRILLNDFCKITATDGKIFEPVKGESDTLAGLLLELSGTIPDVHAAIPFRNFLFIIESVDKRRIRKIKVIINPEENAGV